MTLRDTSNTLHLHTTYGQGNTFIWALKHQYSIQHTLKERVCSFYILYLVFNIRPITTFKLYNHLHGLIFIIHDNLGIGTHKQSYYRNPVRYYKVNLIYRQ